jgi:hypothetical protein
MSHESCVSPLGYGFDPGQNLSIAGCFTVLENGENFDQVLGSKK